MAQVLCTGVDGTLLQTRRMMLERAGHTVTTVTLEDELREACETTKFDVAVIGQSVSPRQKRRVADLIRNHCPTAKVLELYSPFEGAAIDDADDSLCVPADVPDDFVNRVAQLAAPEKRRKHS
ncbi:MAG: hypothetical protein ACRD3E_11555 [Terriglobales bacterium]